MSKSITIKTKQGGNRIFRDKDEAKRHIETNKLLKKYNTKNWLFRHDSTITIYINSNF